MNKINRIPEFKPGNQTIFFVSKFQLDAGESEVLDANPFFTAEKEEVFLTQLDGKKCFLVGLKDEDSIQKLKNISKKFSYNYRKKFDAENTTIVFPKELKDEQVKALIQGLFDGVYEIKKSEDDFIHPLWNEDLEISLYMDEEHADLTKIGQEAQILTEGKFLGMDLLNMPPNHKNSEILVEFIADFAKDLNLDFKVMNKKECREAGMDAFLAVNQGSAYEPAFIILEYKPEYQVKSVGLIGKCITFDTGGISIKPSANMHYMKSDMGGATTVLGTMLAATKLKLNHHIIAILPATDNVVDKHSYLPGDVVSSYSGKTIEVINTDAEGRMTLADALSYMKEKYNPDIMVDIATLTGSAVRTLGYKAAAMMTVSDNLAQHFSESGERTGEKVWRLPLWDEYLEDIKSDVADLKHISLSPMSDVIYAGKFLEQFTGEHPEWVHLDIAGVAFGDNVYSKDKSATGYGVELLIDFLQNVEDQSFLA